MNTVPSETKVKASGVFDAVRDLGPADLLDFLEQMALLLPDEVRYRLRRVVASAGGRKDALQRALEVVRTQWEGLQAEDKVRIAVIGPARTGKSSLIAAIGEGSVERIASLFTVYDLQGLDEYLGYGKSDRVLADVRSADVILMVLDGSAGITGATSDLVQEFAALAKPIVLVLNKMDLVEKPRKAVADARQAFGKSVVPTSVRDPQSIRRLLKRIVSVHPQSLYALSRQLPSFRSSICRGIVSQAAFGTGVIGALPLPISDLLPISAIQVSMLLKIARAHGFLINRERARELLPLLGAGLLVREGCHRLQEWVPDKSKLLSIAVGGTWTYLVGLATVEYFNRLCAGGEAGLLSSEQVAND